MSSPLPALPATPLPSLTETLPADPLGSPPAAPIIGKRGGLPFPAGGRAGRAHATRPPLPSLAAISRPNPARQQAQAQAADRAERRKALRLQLASQRRQQAQAGAGAALGQAVRPAQRERPAPAPAPPAPAPVAQRPHVPGRMAQPPISPRPGMRATLRQRIERQRRGAEAYNALHATGENPMAGPLRGVVPPADSAEYDATAEAARSKLTPEQVAKIRADVARTQAILRGEGENPMANAMRHMGKPTEGA